MKKKLNFIISLILVLALAVGALAMPASSYDNDVDTSSSAILLVNLDTDTVCYANHAENKWFASYMCELVTFIIGAQRVLDAEEREVRVTQAFIDSLPYSDGCLDQFVGMTLKFKDLMGIMLFTSGSDAAYLIAETVSGSADDFVKLMNKKVKDIGCENTHFETPGYSESNQHYTTCYDLYRIFVALYKVDMYREMMEKSEYTLIGYEDDDSEDSADYTVVSENSFINPASPYYFRYSTGGKYSYGPTSRANIVGSTRYRGKSYLFVALRGKNSSEQNVFADARRMTTWAYLNLSDRKVIDTDNSITDYTVTTDWGEYTAALFASNAAYKTLPMDFDSEKFTYDFSVPDSVIQPVFEGQSIGSAEIFYDGDKLDDINLVSSSAEGISLIGDLSHFALYGLSEILINEPPAEDETVNEEGGASAAAAAEPTSGSTGAEDL